MILMIQTGYKYTFFGEDAEIASRELNILSSQHHNIATAIIPVVRLHVHIRRLVEKGYKVGVVNETETASMKAAGENKYAPVSRELFNIYTKATLIGDDVNPLCQEEEHQEEIKFGNYIVCVAESTDIGSSTRQRLTNLAFVAFDPSTGIAVHDTFQDGPQREKLDWCLEHLNPAEIIAPYSLSLETEQLLKCRSSRLERLGDELFDFTGALVKVATFFCEDKSLNTDSPSFHGMSDFPPLTLVCFSALIHHLKQFGLLRALRHDGIQRFTSDLKYLQMDATVLRNLEIFQNGEGFHKGSLFWALDHTRTKFGSRMLHDWISQPLRDYNTLQSRQEAITELLHDEATVVQKLQNILEGISDIEYGLTTCLHQRCGPSMFYTILETLRKLQTDFKNMCESKIEELRSSLLRDLLKDTVSFLSNVDHFLQNLNQEAVRNGDKLNLFNNYSSYPSVTMKMEQIAAVNQRLEDLKLEVTRNSECSSLNFIVTSDYESFIEVKVDQSTSVPDSWIKISETKQVIRFRLTDMDSLTKELHTLKDELLVECNAAWTSYLKDFNAHYFVHKKALKNVATLDVLLSLVHVAKQEGYCRPTLVNSEEMVIKIEKGRHPVIPLFFSSQDQFVGNDTNLDSSKECCMIITGPNMGGKSCYIRQVALILIMAHIGSYIPAENATISIFDAVFTRMGARDDLYRGRSTLLMELEEASTMLHKATRQSLVLLDELGRGTSSRDGTSIALATLHYFLSQVQCLTLFVTHYAAITDMQHHFFNLTQNYHVAFKFHNEDIEAPEVLTFLYKVTLGLARQSYGLNVARLADIPPRLLQRAAEKTKMLHLWQNLNRNTMQHFQEVWHTTGHKEDRM